MNESEDIKVDEYTTPSAEVDIKEEKSGIRYALSIVLIVLACVLTGLFSYYINWDTFWSENFDWLEFKSRSQESEETPLSAEDRERELEEFKEEIKVMSGSEVEESTVSRDDRMKDFEEFTHEQQIMAQSTSTEENNQSDTEPISFEERKANNEAFKQESEKIGQGL